MAIDPQAVIEKARADAAKRERQSNEEFEREYRRIENLKDKFIKEYLRPATAEDYNKWLYGYIMAGGRLGRIFDHPLITDELFVAVKDIKDMPCLLGAQAIEIIIPEDIEGPDRTMRIGHSTIYYMASFHVSHGDLPSVFSDTKF